MPYYMEENQLGQYWDGKSFVKNPKSDSEFNRLFLRNLTIMKEHDENNCHIDGVFKCPRCWRKHYIVSNYDLLCDGCADLVSKIGSDFVKNNIEIWKNMGKKYFSNIYIPEIRIRILARDMLEAKLDT